MFHLQNLTDRYPQLAAMRSSLLSAFAMLRDCYQGGGKLLLCGNGGSACDCEHITGELMKGFLRKRPLSPAEREPLDALGEEGAALAGSLQRALPALVLMGLMGLSTAFGNDVSPAMTYAQQTFAYARRGDVLLGISTSGNSENVRLAALAARRRDVLNPERIVIGFVYARCVDLLKPPMLSALRAEALGDSADACAILPSGLGERIGDYAALCLASMALGQ